MPFLPDSMLDTQLTLNTRRSNSENRTMMFNAPDERLYLARLRQDELREEAAAARRTNHSTGASIATDRVRGIHLHLGRLLIVVGRTLCEEDTRQTSPSHS
jgi:hypothetical protein